MCCEWLSRDAQGPEQPQLQIYFNGDDELEVTLFLGGVVGWVGINGQKNKAEDFKTQADQAGTQEGAVPLGQVGSHTGLVPVIGGCKGQVLGASWCSHPGVCRMDNEGCGKGPHPSVTDAIVEIKTFLSYNSLDFLFIWDLFICFIIS